MCYRLRSRSENEDLVMYMSSKVAVMKLEKTFKDVAWAVKAN